MASLRFFVSGTKRAILNRRPIVNGLLFRIECVALVSARNSENPGNRKKRQPI
jgi:hypothetical protein